MPGLIEQQGQQLWLRFHPGQRRAWGSLKRFILILAGLQSGKTEFGPPWLYREIQHKGPGDYMIVGPMFTLMDKKVTHIFDRYFKDILKLGDYRKGVFTFDADGEGRTFGAEQKVKTKIFFGHAQRPGSLESATAKAVWCDEPGQDEFKMTSWDAIQGRLAVNQGRALLTTTPYNLGWMFQQLYRPWIASGRNHPEIDVINFKSTENPTFPRAEYDRMKLIMPTWRFRMRYDGEFQRPAGVIYDCYDDVTQVVPKRKIPDHWRRFVGLDFGGQNTAATYWAEELFDGTDVPTGKLEGYREYHPRRQEEQGAKSIAQHVEDMKRGEPRIDACYGGAGSEDQWRTEFTKAGLLVREPKIASVDVGIEKTWGIINGGPTQFVVQEHLRYLRDELASYSYELDPATMEPIDKIKDKETYHLLDSARYVLPSVKGVKRDLWVG